MKFTGMISERDTVAICEAMGDKAPACWLRYLQGRFMGHENTSNLLALAKGRGVDEDLFYAPLPGVWLDDVPDVHLGQDLELLMDEGRVTGWRPLVRVADG